jgi:hypothetical protein
MQQYGRVDDPGYRNSDLINLLSQVLKTPIAELVDDMRNLLYTLQESKFLQEQSYLDTTVLTGYQETSFVDSTAD